MKSSNQPSEKISDNNKWRNIFSDPEIYFIFFLNGILIWQFLNHAISPGTIIWIYFFQNLFIGAFYFLRMLFLHQFSTENFKMNNHPVEATAKTRRSTAFFFLFHFSFFHLVYFVFLMSMVVLNSFKFDTHFFFLAMAGLMVNFLFSIFSTIQQDRITKPNIGTLMFTPYIRIFPMHIFIIAGFWGSAPGDNAGWLHGVNSFLLFLILKTLADALLHVVTMKTWKQKREPVYNDVF